MHWVQDFLILWELESPSPHQAPTEEADGDLGKLRSPRLGQVESSICQAELLVI